MSNHQQIRCIKYKDIDFTKWDQCIISANNFKVYALSWFLDYVSEKWYALVYGDYQFVMPLTAKRKYGIKYLYQPPFCQQLGIFPAPSDEIQEKFAYEIKKKFRFADIQISSQNNPSSFSGFSSTSRTNLILPLIETYPALFSQFSKNTQRNIIKAQKEKLTVVHGLNAREFVSLKRKYNIGNVPDNSYSSLEKIISRTQTDGTGIILAAYSGRNDLCAGAFVLRSGNRLFFLSAFSTDEGKANSAMYAIVDWLIREYSGKGFLLDFEGSSIEGVARFYRGFGSYIESYHHLYLNRLPFPINLFKKNNSKLI